MTDHTTPAADDEMYASLAAAPVAGLTAEQGARTAAEADKARAREVDAHSEHRRAVCEALGRHTGLDWPTAIHRVQLAVAGAADRDRAAIAQGAAERETRQARQGESDAVRALDLAEAAHNVRTQEANGWHTRAERAEATIAVVREIAPRLAAHAKGFQDVLDDTDRGPWGNTVGADLADLCAALDDKQPAEAQPEPQQPAGRTSERRPCDQPGCIGGHRYMLWARVYDCPGLTSQREQPADPAAAAVSNLAAAIRTYMEVVAPAAMAAARALGLTPDVTK